MVGRGRNTDTLYVLQVRLHKGEVNTVKKGAYIDLWHKRLGHICEKELYLLARNQYLPNLKDMTLKSCDDCSEGKIHRVVFHSYPPCTKSCILDLIHIGVCFLQEKTIGGA